MPPAAHALREVEVFRRQAQAVHRVVRTNVAGLSHEDSLIQPQPGGSCLNWVIGHLLWAYDGALPLLEQEPVLGQATLAQYARGAPPLKEPAAARDFGELMAAWDVAVERFDAGLSTLTADMLDRPAPWSPNNDPNETVRSLLTVHSFHQAYHTGQTALLRRIAGKEGAIR